MRVFVAGATGVIGRRLIPMLVEAGHDVTGMTRSKEKAERLRAVGAEPVVCDALDREGVRAAVTLAKPDVVVHELTDIPPDLDIRSYDRQMAGNDRLRQEGTPILVDAAAEAGAKRIVAQSVAFAYAPRGPMVVDEDAPLYQGAPPIFRRSVEALAALERAVLEAPGLQGVVLRYGYFYGPGTSYASDGGLAAMARKRKLPVVGSGRGTFSFIHVDDAARATVAALEIGAPGVYNIVDDEPAPMREWVPVYAEVLRAKRPLRVPRWVARLGGGPLAAESARLRGASNAKAKQELGWEPLYSTWRTGFREALG